MKMNMQIFRYNYKYVSAQVRELKKMGAKIEGEPNSHWKAKSENGKRIYEALKIYDSSLWVVIYQFGLFKKIRCGVAERRICSMILGKENIKDGEKCPDCKVVV